MEFHQSTHRGLLLCSSISCGVPGGVCCLSARGIVRSGPTVVMVTLIHHLDLRIGPGLALNPPGLGRSSRCILVPLINTITTSGPLAPPTVCILGRSSTIGLPRRCLPTITCVTGHGKMVKFVLSRRNNFSAIRNGLCKSHHMLQDFQEACARTTITVTV